MKNEIYFYYKLSPIRIHQYQNKTIFFTNTQKYILHRIDEDINIVEEKYKLQGYLTKIGKHCHKIIENITGNIITQIRSNQYVLIEINMETRKIKLEDLIYLMEIKIDVENFARIKRGDWKKLWERKIDYLEHECESVQKYGGSSFENFDFFVGMTENCISLMNEVNMSNTFYTISHDRINPKTTTDEFYDPLGFIIDIRVRDIAEYIKKIDEIDNRLMLIKKILMNNKMSDNEIMMLFIRILFPSEFFDSNDKTMNKHNECIQIKRKNIISNTYFKDIKKIYLYLKDIIILPNIEWLNAAE